MLSLRAISLSIQRFLPEPLLARYASLAFSLSVLSFLVSIAVAQTALAVSVVLFVVHLGNSRLAVRTPRVLLPLLAFCVTTLFSALLSSDLLLSAYAVRKLILFVILLLTVNLVVTLAHLRFLLKGLFFVASLAGLVAAAQVLGQYLQARTMDSAAFYFTMTYTRATGFMGHWMDFSGQQMLVLAALAACFLARPRIKWIPFLLLIAGSLVLSFTRGAWVGSLASLLLLIVLRRPKLLWAVPVVALAAFLLAPSLVRERVMSIFQPGSDPSISIRLEMWQVGWNIIRRHPWLGVGPNQVDEVYESFLPKGTSAIEGYHGHLHNNPLQLAAERGLFCLAAWIWLMALWGKHLLALRGRLNGESYLADGALAVWLSLLVQGMFEFSFGSSEVLMLFLFLVSVPYAAEEILKGTPKGSDPPSPSPSLLVRYAR